MRVLSFPHRRGARRNPYLDLLVTALERSGVEVEDYTGRRGLTRRYDVVHVHWPEQVLGRSWGPRTLVRALVFLVAIRLQRARGGRLVWTVHNLRPHEASEGIAVRLLWRAYVAQIDSAISLTEAGIDLIRQHHPALASTPMFVVPHGHYRDRYPPQGRESARQGLGLPPEAGVLAFVGLIRRYKNVLGLLGAFAGVGDGDARLLVAGEPRDADLGREVAEAARADDRVVAHLGFLAPDDVSAHLAAADCVVLPFRDLFNSGSALLALSLDRPILVPSTPTTRELERRIGARWVRTYDGPLDAETLAQALKAAQGVVGERAPLEPFDWQPIAHATVAAYGGGLGAGEAVG